MNLGVDISKKVSPALRELVDGLEGPGKVEAHQAMGVEVQETTVLHLRHLAGSRHSTAGRLGATPSGHLAQAAEKVAEANALSADGNAATLSINHPGMARALRDVRIVPKNAKALTIPVNALAYNRRAGEFDDLFILGRKATSTGNLLVRRTADGGIEPMYLLLRSVTQKQDRTLLPSDADLEDAAMRGLTGYVTQKLQEAGVL